VGGTFGRGCGILTEELSSVFFGGGGGDDNSLNLLLGGIFGRVCGIVEGGFGIV
jgi:hypothetical protein